MTISNSAVDKFSRRLQMDTDFPRLAVPLFYPSLDEFVCSKLNRHH